MVKHIDRSEARQEQSCLHLIHLPFISIIFCRIFFVTIMFYGWAIFFEQEVVLSLNISFPVSGGKNEIGKNCPGILF